MSEPRLIDSHTHIQFPAYDEDREAVISRAVAHGIWMVNIGTQESTSRGAILLAEQYPEGMYATVGFHPGHINVEGNPTHHDEWEKNVPSEEIFNLETFRELASHPKAIGIGECGLDYYRNNNKGLRTKQEQVFRTQVELANELRKPLVIHCREAFDDLIRILSSYSLVLSPERTGVIHFFSGTKEDAKILMELGFYLGFGGVVTFAKMYEGLVRKIPLERIVLETDAPYVAPVPYRGKRNEPLYIEATAAKIAEIKEISPEEVMRVTTKNARTLFGV